MAFHTEKEALDALRTEVNEIDPLDGDVDFFVGRIHEDPNFAKWLLSEDDGVELTHDFHFKPSGRTFDIVVRLEEDPQ